MKETNLTKTIALLKKKNLTDNQYNELKELLNNRSEEIEALNNLLALYAELKNSLYYAYEWRKPKVVKSMLKWSKILETHLRRLFNINITSIRNIEYHFEEFNEADLTILQDEKDTTITLSDRQVTVWENSINVLKKHLRYDD